MVPQLQCHIVARGKGGFSAGRNGVWRGGQEIHYWRGRVSRIVTGIARTSLSAANWHDIAWEVRVEIETDADDFTQDFSPLTRRFRTEVMARSSCEPQGRVLASTIV